MRKKIKIRLKKQTNKLNEKEKADCFLKQYSVFTDDQERKNKITVLIF